jgi:hypothetical protein
MFTDANEITSSIDAKTPVTSVIESAYTSVTPYSLLLSKWNELPTGTPTILMLTSQTSLPPITWTGQIFSKRVMHRSLVFLSLCTDGRVGLHACVDICIRREVVGDSAIEEATHVLKAGDVIRVSGVLERKSGQHHPFLHSIVPINRVFPWTQSGKRNDAYLRYAIPPQEARAGLPSFYFTHIAGGADAESTTTTLTVTESSNTTTNARTSRIATAAAREEMMFEGVSLHLLCRYYVSSNLTQGCRRLGGCGMLHDTGIPLLSQLSTEGDAARRRVVAAWGRWRARVRRLGHVEHEGDEGGAARVLDRAGHSARAGCFASWLLEQAPPLGRNCHILDVAGGRGDVAAELARAGARIVTVDPRLAKPSKATLRAAKRERENGILVRGSTEHIAALFNDDFIADPSNEIMLKSCQVVIGFHPDQATDAILDFALARGIPIALVPCCVFARSFPERRREDGGTVHSFEHFVTYLKDKFIKAGRPAKVSFLEYAGANLVLHEGLDRIG